MFATLKEIAKDIISLWRQEFGLGIFTLQKKSRGSALGWFWFFAKPAVYVFVFWFALEIGLRSSSSSGPAPFFLWLMAGLVPWFFIQEMLGAGLSILDEYSYLVTKIKFPLPCIPVIYIVSIAIIQIGLIAALAIVAVLLGVMPSIYWIQIPIAFVIMLVFWYMFSFTASILSAISKDFNQLAKTLSTPLFWLSGIIFNVKDIDLNWIQVILDFDPITFIASMYRAAVYDQCWITEDVTACVCFAVVFLLQMIAMVLVYKRTREEVRDVL